LPPEYTANELARHGTRLNEFYRITLRKEIYTSLVELQIDLDEWVRYYNEERVH